MSQTHTPAGGDNNQDDFGPGEYDPALWQSEPEIESAGFLGRILKPIKKAVRAVTKVVKKVVHEVRDTVADVVDGVGRVVREVADTVSDVAEGVISTTGRVITGLVGGVVGGSGADSGVEGSTQASEAPNFGPIRSNNNPNFSDTDSDHHRDALRVGEPFLYRVLSDTFHDEEGDTITLSLSPDSQLPPGIRFDPATRTFSGTPLPITDNDGERFEVTIVGTDPQGRTATDGIVFNVVWPNRAPRLSDPIPTQNFDVGDRVFIDLLDHFEDPDTYDSLTFTVSHLPQGLRSTASGRYIFGRPQSAFDEDITITAVDDGNLTFSIDLRITVAAPPPPNNPPEVGTRIDIGNLSQGVALIEVIPANAFTDPDGDRLTLTESGLPDGLTFELVDPDGDGTGSYRITGTPTTTGRFDVTITATDEHGATAFQSLTVRVYEPVPDFDSLEEDFAQSAAPPGPPIFPPEPIIPQEPLVDPDLAVAQEPQLPGAICGDSPTIHSAEDPGSETLTGTNCVDIFILTSPTSVLSDVDFIRNFQQGTDKIHLPGISSVEVSRRDIDDDGTAETVLVGGTGAARGAFAVLADFTGTLMVTDFDASALDPALVGSVIEVTNVTPEIA